MPDYEENQNGKHLSAQEWFDEMREAKVRVKEIHPDMPPPRRGITAVEVNNNLVQVRELPAEL